MRLSMHTCMYALLLNMQTPLQKLGLTYNNELLVLDQRCACQAQMIYRRELCPMTGSAVHVDRVLWAR